ncbi:E3 ubiquitin-protein ligase rnf213-alpha-like [Watersipora subatra]|uniref:E3 ubiquitin-protein ligase rnf213-alpha-like n=1 Tax=Watersipora subatra TaxID=2589382 RepID=UPI00355BC427
MVLSIYEFDKVCLPPTRNEVMICNSSTNSEEVRLFLNRALADPNSYYCMVNCHLLNYDVCRVIEDRLGNTADDTVKNYGLAFLYAEEKRDARIRAILESYLVKNPAQADIQQLQKYLAKTLLKIPSRTKSAGKVDPDELLCRSFARLIRSTRAGVGKSLHKKNLCAAVRANKDLSGKDITIPVYKTVDTDVIIKRLNDDLGNGYGVNCYHTIHFDIAHEVKSGVDELLFNLIILKSLVNSEGVVWQAQPTQYYIIECMPYTKEGRSVHELMDLLPTTMCHSPCEELRQPTKSSQVYSYLILSYSTILIPYLIIF